MGPAARNSSGRTVFANSTSAIPPRSNSNMVRVARATSRSATRSSSRRSSVWAQICPSGGHDQRARVLVGLEARVARGEPDRVLRRPRDDHGVVHGHLPVVRPGRVVLGIVAALVSRSAVCRHCASPILSEAMILPPAGSMPQGPGQGMVPVTVTHGPLARVAPSPPVLVLVTARRTPAGFARPCDGASRPTRAADLSGEPDREARRRAPGRGTRGGSAAPRPGGRCGPA